MKDEIITDSKFNTTQFNAMLITHTHTHTLIILTILHEFATQMTYSAMTFVINIKE